MNIFCKNKSLLLNSGVLLALSFPASADVLATWVAAGNGGNSSSAPFDFSAPAVPGVQSAVLSLPGTLSPGTATEQVNNNNYGFSATSQSTRFQANAQGHFFEFEIVAEPGKLLNLTSLDADFQNGGGNFGQFNRAQVRSSIDNFGSPIGSNIGGNNNTNLDLNGFDLSGAEFQGITDATFRIIFWERPANSAGNNNRIRLNRNNGVMTLNGAVVPEISSALPLATLFGFSVLGFRKRRE